MEPCLCAHYSVHTLGLRRGQCYSCRCFFDKFNWSSNERTWPCQNIHARSCQIEYETLSWSQLDVARHCPRGHYLSQRDRVFGIKSSARPANLRRRHCSCANLTVSSSMT